MTARSGRCEPGALPGPASVTPPSAWRRQGYDLQLTCYDEKGWRATFYTTGLEHSPTSATGTGGERTPWHATQRAVCGTGPKHECRRTGWAESIRARACQLEAGARRGGQAVMRVRRISVIAAMFLLALTATASAQCAWDVRASIVDHPVRDSIGGFDLP